MQEAPGILHQLAVAARLAWRALARRATGASPRPASDAQFRASLMPWIASLPPELLAGHAFCYLPADQPPWIDTGLDLAAGESVTVLAHGRVYLSRLLDVWVAPALQLWYRVGESGPIFRGTRDTHTFVAQHDGRLWLGGYFPGEWSDTTGRLATPPDVYAGTRGGTSALVLRWRPGVQPAQALLQLATKQGCPDHAAAEARRLAEPASPAPEGWNYLWLVGPAEIYRSHTTGSGHAAIACHTHADTGILQRDVRVPLAPDTRLHWSWRVDELPIDLAEDTLPSHDYVGIAVEFDDGQDIAYNWSSSLPAGTAYRCPLPNWTHRETHVVVRTGSAELGRWLDEQRDLYADYRTLIGGRAREVVRVWLIALSVTARGTGRCEYARIRLCGGDRTVDVA